MNNELSLTVGALRSALEGLNEDTSVRLSLQGGDKLGETIGHINLGNYQIGEVLTLAVSPGVPRRGDWALFPYDERDYLKRIMEVYKDIQSAGIEGYQACLIHDSAVRKLQFPEHDARCELDDDIQMVNHIYDTYEMRKRMERDDDLDIF